MSLFLMSLWKQSQIWDCIFFNCLWEEFILSCIFSSMRLIAVAVSVHHRHLLADTYDVELKYNSSIIS